MLDHVQKRCAEGYPEEVVIEVSTGLPFTGQRNTAFRQKDMDMGIPFEIPTEGVQDTDETRDKVLFVIEIVEHAQDDTADSVKEFRKERAVSEEVMTQFFGDGKNQMPVFAVQDFKRHGSDAILRVFDTAGGTESGVTAKRDTFDGAALFAAIDSEAFLRVTATEHSVDVFNDRSARMKRIDYFFIVIQEDLLQNISVHGSIMQKQRQKNNYPSRLRGRGVEVSQTLFYMFTERGLHRLSGWRVRCRIRDGTPRPAAR